ncbi:MAG: type II secretion system F family protein [Fimbriimonadales bacterium]|nr:type II secretion system F family protein [Fimbriimonadales bacterium]
MPVYRYQAVDSGGRVVAGELSAADVNQAQQILGQQGLRVVMLAANPTVASASSPMIPPVASASSPTSTLGRDAQATGVASASSPTSMLGRDAQATNWERSRVSPHAMSAWLIQLRSMLKAGMSPANAFQSLSQRTLHKGLQRASMEIAHDAVQGVALSDSMRKFPNLFPAFLVGAFRAAEHGGYLPEMLDRLIEYYEQHRTVRRWSLLSQGCLWQAVLLLPLIAPFGIGFVWGFQDFQGGGRAEAMQAILGGFGKAFLRYGLPMLLILMALMLLGYLVAGSERLAARLRLRGLGFFTYADWVRAQSLEQYLFHLGRLTHAGVYPATAHALAAGAIPNRALAEALLSIDLGRAEGAAHIDAALERSGLFPIEEIMMARTGVQTGDLPNILQTLASWYRERAVSNLQRLPRAFFRLMIFVSILATGIAMISLAWGYYSNIFHAVDEFMGVGE